MTKAKLLNVFINITNQRNASRRQIFFPQNRSSIVSEEKLALYEETEQRYFEFLHQFFMNKKNEALIYNFLDSSDSYERYLGLSILIDGFPSKELLSKLVNKIVAFCIEGNDQELVLGRKLVKLKMSNCNNLLEAAVDRIMCSLDNLLKSCEDFYYLYLNLGILILAISPTPLPLADSYLKWGKQHLNDDQVKETYFAFLCNYKRQLTTK